MKIRARITATLSLDPEEFCMPVDGDPTEELTDMVTDLLEYIDGAILKILRKLNLFFKIGFNIKTIIDCYVTKIIIELIIYLRK